MIYPKFLKDFDTIGVTAPSAGINNIIKQNRLDFAIKNLSKENLKIIETPNVRKCMLGKSDKTEIQVKEFMDLILRDEVKSIICASGGDFLLELLPFLDYATIKKHPKWIQGYSDPTSLLYVLTTKYDIATLYASTIGNFGMNPLHQSLKDNLRILKGEKIIQTNFDFYEQQDIEYITGNEPYHLDTPVKWQILNQNNVDVEGRLIGGCIDCLLNIIGTPYDNTLDFLEKYKNDGFIWYFDNAELSSESLIRGLWQLKASGWFRYVKCFLFGRMFPMNSYYEITKENAVFRVLKELNVPIIMDVDLGHLPPRLTLINGAVAKIKKEEDKFTIEFEMRS